MATARRLVGSILSWGANSVGASTTARYLYPGYHEGLAEIDELAWVSPTPGLVRRLRAKHNETAGNGGSITYTLLVNGVATLLAAAVPSTTAEGSDLVNAVSVQAGDRLALRASKAAGIGASPKNIVVTAELG